MTERGGSRPADGHQPLRILMLHNKYLQRGGEEESAALDVDLLRSRGHQVSLIEEDNSRVIDLGALRTAFRATWSSEAYATISAALRRERYDLLHVQNFFPLFSPSVHWAAHRLGVPVVQTLRNYRLDCANGILFRDGHVCTDCVGRSIPWPALVHRCYRGSLGGSGAVVLSQLSHRFLQTWHRCVDAFIALSEFSRSEVVEAGLDPERVHVKANFLSPDPGPGSGGENFLFVGRLSAEKGLVTLIHAWKRLAHLDITLDVVGSGPMADELRSMSDGLKVRWFGRIDHPDAIDRMGRVRGVIVPSECYETFGRVAMESMARGTPAIVSAHGALAELVDHRRTGLHFPPGDPVELASRVLELHSAPGDWMRSEARDAFITRFSEEPNYRVMQAVYSAAIERHSRTEV